LHPVEEKSQNAFSVLAMKFVQRFFGLS